MSEGRQVGMRRPQLCVLGQDSRAEGAQQETQTPPASWRTEVEDRVEGQLEDRDRRQRWRTVSKNRVCATVSSYSRSIVARSVLVPVVNV